jgi:phosphoribosylanthranilate isomerase
MLKTIVKASQIAHLTDARYFAAWYVDFIGFDFRTQPAQKQAIMGWLAGVQAVAEVDLDTDAADVQAILTHFGIQWAELSPFYELEEAKKIQQARLIKRLHCEQPAELENLDASLAEWASVAEIMVISLNFSVQELLAAEDLQAKFQNWNQKYKILLEMSLEPALIPDLLEKIQPYGLVLKGGLEEKVGFKSFDELDAIFEQLEE